MEKNPLFVEDIQKSLLQSYNRIPFKTRFHFGVKSGMIWYFVKKAQQHKTQYGFVLSFLRPKD